MARKGWRKGKGGRGRSSPYSSVGGHLRKPYKGRLRVEVV